MGSHRDLQGLRGVYDYTDTWGGLRCSLLPKGQESFWQPFEVPCYFCEGWCSKRSMLQSSGAKISAEMRSKMEPLIRGKPHAKKIPDFLETLSNIGSTLNPAA